jgi:hypothetical protein
MLEGDLPYYGTVHEVLIDLFRAFAGLWKSTPTWSPITFHTPSSKEVEDSAYMVLQYHFRCVAKDRTSEDERKRTPGGLILQRDSGDFPALKDQSDKRFREQRAAIVLFAFRAQSGANNDSASPAEVQSQPAFRIEVVHDIATIKYPQYFSCMNREERGFSVDSNGTGIHLFQVILDSILSIWENEWTSCLDEIEESVRFPVNSPPVFVPDSY